MPGQLQGGAWNAAFLAGPYITVAEETYGQQELADLDQGETTDFPVDADVATAAWARQHPRTAAAFVRAIEAGQAIADAQVPAAQDAVRKADDLPAVVTALMTRPGFPTGPVDGTQIQRIATAMLTFGMLSPQYPSEVRRGTLVGSMIGPGS
jgi:NitT/TauT family transport system substrate-binding protein